MDNLYDENEEKIESYIFPPNYNDGGKIWQGRLDLRNTIEAVIFDVIGIYLFYNIGIIFAKQSTIFILILLIFAPITAICIYGINGDSVGQFIKLFFVFLRNKRILRYRRIVKDGKSKIYGSYARPKNSKKKQTRK